MIKWFLIHQWKSTWRSPIWQKNLAIKILIGFFGFIMILYLLGIGLFINKILDEAYPGQDHVFIFNGYLLYFLVIDLFMRFMLQGLPRLTIESYLHLPIGRKKIVHYVVNRTLTSVFNFLPLFIMIPVSIKIVAVQYNAADAWYWIFMIMMLVLANNFFATYLKRQLGSKPGIVGIVGVLIILLFVLDYFNVFSLSDVSSHAFGYILTYKYLVLIPVVWMLTAYRLHYHFLKKRLYPEEIEKRKSTKIDSISEIRYLKSLGITGSVIALEMKLFWRNKRTRTIVYMLPLFLLYGLYFYVQPKVLDLTGMLIFVGIFMSGGMMLNYTNYAFAYESGYFDSLMTKNIDFHKYIRIKLFIAILVSTICYVLTIPYVFFGTRIFFINSMTFLYNIGVLSILLLYMATLNKQRMDLTRGAAFNYQGIGASNWLAMLPAFLLPVLIYWPFSAAGYPDAGIMFIGILGLIGLVFNRFFVGFVIRNFYKRKYIMMEGFRQR